MENGLEGEKKRLEDVMLRYPNSGRYLQDYVDKISDALKPTAPPPAERDEVKGVSVRTTKGRTYSNCTLTEVVDGKASILHAEGVAGILIAQLSEKDRQALSSTSKEWHLLEPEWGPRGKEGSYEHLLLIDGKRLVDVEYQGIEGADLVLKVGGVEKRIGVDLVPDPPASAPFKRYLAESRQRAEQMAAVASDDANGRSQPIEGVVADSDQVLTGDAMLKKARKIEEHSKGVIARLEGELANLTKTAKKLEDTFNEAGGDLLLKNVKEQYGKYYVFAVKRVLLDSGFEKLGGAGDNVYDIVFEQGGSAILVTPSRIISGTMKGLYLSLSESVMVTLVDGLTDERQVYVEAPKFKEEDAPAIVRLEREWREALAKARVASESIKLVTEESEAASAALRRANEWIAALRIAQVIVSPQLAQEDFSASIQDREFLEVMAAIKSGSLAKIDEALDSSSHSSPGSKFRALDEFPEKSTTEASQRLPDAAEVDRLFESLREKKFRVEVVSAHGLRSNNPEDNRRRERLVCVSIPSLRGSTSPPPPSTSPTTQRDPFADFDFQFTQDQQRDFPTRISCDKAGVDNRAEEMASGKGYYFSHSRQFSAVSR